MARALLFLLLSLLQLAAQAQVQPPVPLFKQAFLTDPQAAMSIDGMAAAQFQPYQGSLGLGFQTGAVWIRLQVEPVAAAVSAAPRRWVVRVGPNYLERIELYAPAPAAGAPWIGQLRGAATPQASRACPDDMHCFAIEGPAAEGGAVYLRVEHRGFMVVHVEVLPQDALPDAVAERIRGLTVSMAIALGLLALGLALLVIDRSLLMLAYCSFQLTIALFIASNAGLLAIALPGVAGEHLVLFNILLYALRGAMTGFLAWSVLRSYRPSRLYHLAGAALLALCGLNVLLILLGHVQLALKGSLLVISLIPFWHLHGTYSTRSLPTALRRVMLVGTIFYILMLLLGLWLAFSADPLIPKKGLIGQIVDWRLNGFAVGVLFFCMALMERSSLKRVRSQELEALRHQAQEARARQAELDERSNLIDMLTHELKNPLGTIRFALASLRQSVVSAAGLKRIQSIDQSARRMDDLIERVASYSKMERTTTPGRILRVEAPALLQELLQDVSDPEQWVVQMQAEATFRCDRQLLWVILENLISNAEKYGEPDQKIHLEVTLEGEMTRVEISNPVDAASVPEAASLFERYYRHPNVQGKPGMGLGLSVVKTAAQKIRGDVAYRHEAGRVFFTLRVPA